MSGQMSGHCSGVVCQSTGATVVLTVRTHGGAELSAASALATEAVATACAPTVPYCDRILLPQDKQAAAGGGAGAPTLPYNEGI